MQAPKDGRDPVRDAIAHGEATPPEYLYWDVPYALRRLRIRFGLRRWQLAAKAGVSASVVGRAEKGADIRLSTLVRLFAAVGCRPVILPAGALYEMDEEQAYLDDAWLEDSRRMRENERIDEWLRGAELQRNASSAAPGKGKSTKR
jgi:transcriptional regulator with XRE-family HTH domain